MKLTTKENSTNYACTIVQIKEVFDIKDADRIKRVIVEGNDVVVSSSVKTGDIMAYFVSGTRLSTDLCSRNNLYTDPELNSDKTKIGFVSVKQSRIKAIKLKGIVSDGLLLPLSGLDLVVNNVSSLLKIGDSFTDIGDTHICEKYFVPVRSGTGQGKQEKKNKLEDVLVDNQFRFHHETEHFIKNLHKFSQEDLIVITRKIHGSSAIIGNVLINRRLSIKERIFGFFGANIPASEYGHVWSSGKPRSKMPKGVASETNVWSTPNQSYYTSDIWERAYKEIGHLIPKGISIYAEIVGKNIQGSDYTYGLDYGIFIYRVTNTSVDGHVYEFSWNAVKKFCEKIGVRHVEEYFSGKVKELVVLDESLLGYLQQKYLNKSYPDCKVDEGICIRLQDSDEIFKLKSPNFILGESNNLEKDIPNIEDEG